MTGGTVVVLGETGRNFAAGMSGGLAYVYDPAGDFASRCNLSMVALEKVLTDSQQREQLDKAIWHSVTPGAKKHSDELILRGLMQLHFKYTGSTRARFLLDNWVQARGRFVKVFPSEYKRALGELHAAQVLTATEKVPA